MEKDFEEKDIKDKFDYLLLRFHAVVHYALERCKSPIEKLLHIAVACNRNMLYAERHRIQ